jgi:circadian clock protein KaiB
MKKCEDSDRCEGSRDNGYVLCLYIVGESRRCHRARKNLERICEEHLQDTYDLEVIDIGENPAAAEEADVVAVPTLVKQHPPPARKVVGDLSQTEKVLAGLNIEA